MSAASDLLTNYQHVIAELDVVTGDKGIFDVHVDDQLVFSKHQAGRHAEPGELLELFEERLAPGTRRFGE